MPDSPGRELHTDVTYCTYAQSEQVLDAKTVTAFSYCDSDAHCEMRFNTTYGSKTAWRARMSSVGARLNSTEKRLDLNSVVYTTCISLVINRRARSRYTCMGAALYDRLVPAPANI